MLLTRWNFKVLLFHMKTSGMKQKQSLCRMAKIKRQREDELCKREARDYQS